MCIKFQNMYEYCYRMNGMVLQWFFWIRYIFNTSQSASSSALRMKSGMLVIKDTFI